MMKSLISELSREIENIKQQVSAQQEIAEAHERLSFITRVTSDCIWDWDAVTGNMYHSESFVDLTGYALNEIDKGEDWWYERIHPEDQERVKKQIAESRASNKTYWSDEYRFRCHDGSYKYLSDKAYIIFREGKAVRGIGAIQDLTEIRQLEAQLASKKANENKALLNAQENERGEISKELHENVSQILSSVSVLLDSVNNSSQEEEKAALVKSQQYLSIAIAEINKISYSLNASLIQEVGLQGPVEDIMDAMRQKGSIAVKFDFAEKLEDVIPTGQKLAIYRIIQEQTNNVLVHARASKVTISLVRKKNLLHLTVQDNGVGFDVANRQTDKGVGFINIRNRVEAFRGTMTIQSAPGQGCLLDIKMPLEH